MPVEKKRMKFKTKLFIFLGSIFGIFPISLFILFYQMPKNSDPYLLDLTGKWKLQSEIKMEYLGINVDDKDWKEVKIPSQLDKQGLSFRQCILRKTITLKKNMQDKDLFMMIFGAAYSTGEVYLNGNLVGEIGVFKADKKIGNVQGMDGFLIEKRNFIPGENTIALYLSFKDLGCIGLVEPRFYLGVNEVLRPYYEKNVFISNFFQYGIVFFSFFMLIIMMILIVTEWKNPYRYLYISTALVTFATLVYNLFFSGAFIDSVIPLGLRPLLIVSSITFICLAITEFTQYYFYQKINIIGKINRIICILVILTFIITVKDEVLMGKIYNNFIYYFFLVIIYWNIIGFKDVFFKKKREYSLIILSSVFMGSLTGIMDLFSNLGIVNMPMVFNITISCNSVLVTVVVFTEFLGISATNKRLTVTLSKANEELKELDHLKDQFLANTSHELRTPLNGIFGLVEAIMDGADGPITDKVKNHLTMVMKSASNLKNLVNNILDLSKIQSGNQNLDIKSHDVKKLLEDEVKPSVSGLFINKPITLEFNIEDDLPAIYADKDKVRQILINLIGNAVKFTEKGYIKISAKNYKENGYVLFQIEDTGIGMQKSDLKVIFEEFRQADGSATRKYEGTGLGLSITKKLIELQGGQIWVDSTPGKGSTFSFILCTHENLIKNVNPDTESIQQTIKEPSLERRMDERSFNSDVRGFIAEDNKKNEIERFPVGHGEKVLLIDDLEINLEALALNLKEKGYTISKAISAKEAIHLLESGEYKLIISDIMMPEMDGYELTKIIRQKEELKNIPIILLTAKTRLEDKKKGFEVGANDYLVKPFELGELLLRMKNTLNPTTCLENKESTKTNDTIYEIDKETKFNKLSKGKEEKILVIDDNSVNLEVLELRLSMNQWKVETAINGEEGLKKYDSLKPDLVLLDIMMPGLNGFEVCKKIRETYPKEMTPIIFLSAKQQQEDKIYGINVGGDDYITKPFDKDELVIRVANHLNKKKMIDELDQKKKLEQEIEAASKIQRALMPQTFPVNEKVEFYGSSQQAGGVGGDYFDILDLGKGKFLCAIADVTGHGITASLVMVKIQTFLKSITPHYQDDLWKILEEINILIIDDMKSIKFVNMCLILIDSEKNILKYANAGHEPFIFYSKKTQTLKMLDLRSFGLGMKKNLSIKECKPEILESGDIFLAYTDGITEAMDKNQNLFGEERINKLLLQNSEKSLISIDKAILDDVANFIKGQPQEDDITILIGRAK